MGVKRKILVLSGKGGVGKSTFTAQLAWAFASDEDTQVLHLFRGEGGALFAVLINLYDTDRNYGRGHLRSLDTYNPWRRCGAGTFIFLWMVTCLRTR